MSYYIVKNRRVVVSLLVLPSDLFDQKPPVGTDHDKDEQNKKHGILREFRTLPTSSTHINIP
jgi:hypothetical protein